MTTCGRPACMIGRGLHRELLMLSTTGVKEWKGLWGSDQAGVVGRTKEEAEIVACIPPGNQIAPGDLSRDSK